MCKVVDFNEYRGNKDTKKNGEVKKRAKKDGKITTDGLSTDALIKEFKQNGRSVFKLVLYIIEQYRCIPGYNMFFEEIKRDMKYNEICPEITNKRLKAPLGVKIKGEWYALEVVTDSSGASALRRKWETIGNYNVRGFCFEEIDLSYRDMKRRLEWKDMDYYEKLKDIVEAVHRYCSGGNFVYFFECRTSIKINGEENERYCTYKMLELSLPDYAILEGTEIKTGDKHLVLLYKYKGREPEKYAEYYRKKYENTGLPLLYKKWYGTRSGTWKSEMMNFGTLSKCLE